MAAASRNISLTDAELSALAREFDAVLGVGLTDLASVDLDLKRTGVEISDAGTCRPGRTVSTRVVHKRGHDDGPAGRWRLAVWAQAAVP